MSQSISKCSGALRHPALWVLTVIAAVLFCWRLEIIPTGDDFVYTHAVTADSDAFFEVQGPALESWGDVAGSAWLHWLRVNGRLANIVTFAVLHLPVWAGAMMSAAAWWLMMWLVLLLGCGRSRAAGCAALTAGAALVGWKWFPWTDNMAITCYFINYGWTCVAALGFVWLWRRSPHAALCSLLGLIAGWMHEIFGLALLGGCMLEWLCRRSLTRTQWIAAAALLLGTALSALAPSTLLRFTSNYTGNPAPAMMLVREFAGLLSRFYPLYAYILALVAVGIVRGKGAVRESLVKNKFWWAVTLVSLGVAAVLHPGPRALWLTDAGLMIALLRLVADNASSWLRPHIPAACVLTAPSVVLLAAVAVQQRDFSREYRRYEAEIRKNGAPWLIHDSREDTPRHWWALDFASAPEPGNLKFIANSMIPTAARSNTETTIFMVPRAADPSAPAFSDLPTLDATGRIRGVWPWVYSLDSLSPGSSVALRLGPPTPRMAPYARMFTSGDDNGRAIISNVHRVMTPAGESIFFLTLDPDRRSANREVKAVEYPG